KIWNASRFVLLNCDDVLREKGELAWETQLAPPELADRWILSRLNRVALEVGEALGEFRFHEAAAALYHYFWDDFCDWYIELSKPFVTAKEGTPQSLAVKRRIIYVLERSLRLLHPIMPYITEELWQKLPHDGETITLAKFVHYDPAQVDESAEREMTLVVDLVTRLRSIRSEFEISPGKPLHAQIAAADNDTGEVIRKAEDHIKRLAWLEQLEFVERLPAGRGYARDVTSGASLTVPLEGLVDFEQERTRLERELGKLVAEREGLEKRLANQDFINRADPDVVERTRERATELESRIAKIRSMIGTL
ncbi:MAG: class I tRNA ligase family protein, partial [Blastocatellia bacterium]|nr:class I tRNA ligase family protein [Blastocatellia bacterium]